MAQTKLLHLPVSAGMHQELDEHACGPGVLQLARNVRFPTQGACRSRPGTLALVSASAADVDYADLDNGTGPDFILEAPGGFVFGKGGYGYRYDAATETVSAAGSYANAQPLGVLDTMAREEVPNGNAEPWPLSQAAASGYVATVYSCGNGQGLIGPGDDGVVLHILTEDGALVTSASYNNAQTACVVVDGDTGNMVLFLQKGTDIIAAAITVATDGVTIGALTPVLLLPGLGPAVLASATSYWAACSVQGTGWGLIWRAPGGGQIRVTLGAGVAGLTPFDQFAPASVGEPVSIYSDGSSLYTGYIAGAGPYDSWARVYDVFAFPAVTGSQIVWTEATGNTLGPPLFGEGPSNSTLVAVTSSPNLFNTEASTVIFGSITAAAVPTLTNTVYQATAFSPPFAGGYMWLRMGGDDNPGASGLRYERAVLVDFMATRAGASDASKATPPVIALCGEAFAVYSSSTRSYGGGWFRQHLCQPARLSSLPSGASVYVCGVPRAVRIENHWSGAGASGLLLSEWLKFSLGGKRMVRRWGDLPVVTGSPVLLRSNEGSRNYNGVVKTLAAQRDGLDLGFHITPGLLPPVVSSGSGGITSGTYLYRVVVERIDADGRRWRSAPSGIQKVTVTAPDDTVELTARCTTDLLRAGSATVRHSSKFVLHVYRTLAGGSDFRRCTPPQGAPLPIASGVFTYVDGQPDAILDREFLYTDGGVLQNDMAPSSRFVAVTEDRIWFAGLWDTTQLQSSKFIVPGEPPQFTDDPSHRVVLPAPCTGIAAQDGVVIAFTAQGVYAVQGAGPTDQGQGAWDSPREVSRSCGCISELSIVETSAGVFFQAARGIYLIPRGLGEPMFVGAPIQDVLESLTSPAITAASFCRLSNTVRFVAGGIVLVLDLSTSAWSQDTYDGNIAGVCDSSSGAVLAQEQADSGRFFRRESDVLREDDLAGSTPAALLRFGKLHPFGIAGWGTVGAGIALFAPLGGLQFPDADVEIELSVDDEAPSAVTYSMSQFDDGVANYRKLFTDTVRQGSAFELSIQVEGLGWRYVGATLELEDLGGGRRMRSDIFVTSLVTETLETLLTEDGDALITER